MHVQCTFTFTYQYLLLILETYICTLPISSSMNKCIVVVVLLFALCATNVNVFLFSLMSMVDFCFPPICMGVCILGRIGRITVIPCIFPLGLCKMRHQDGFLYQAASDHTSLPISYINLTPKSFLNLIKIQWCHTLSHRKVVVKLYITFYLAVKIIPTASVLFILCEATKSFWLRAVLKRKEIVIGFFCKALNDDYWDFSLTMFSKYIPAKVRTDSFWHGKESMKSF